MTLDTHSGRDVKAVAAKLTKAQRHALASFDEQWTAGPTLSDATISEIMSLEALGLLDRRFRDEGPPIHSIGEACLSVKLSACWHFRLTNAGLAVRATLENDHG
jgi:hypothetical protein